MGLNNAALASLCLFSVTLQCKSYLCRLMTATFPYMERVMRVPKWAFCHSDLNCPLAVGELLLTAFCIEWHNNVSRAWVYASCRESAFYACKYKRITINFILNSCCEHISTNGITQPLGVGGYLCEQIILCRKTIAHMYCRCYVSWGQCKVAICELCCLTFFFLKYRYSSFSSLPLPVLKVRTEL